MRRPLPLLTMALLAWPLLPVPDAAAQFSRGGRVPRPEATATRPPPPALPGLQNRNVPEPIPADPNANLSPNAALFDAINRGDIAAARDAIARGAEIEARNVLGLTALDAAVDQNRTDIMFYLLSIRAGLRTIAPPQDRDAPPEAAGRGGRGRPGPTREAALREDPPPGPRGNANATPVPGAGDLTVPALRAPRLWQNDGGAAQPDIGFLGFDAGRPAGAQPPPGERPIRAASARRG